MKRKGDGEGQEESEAKRPRLADAALVWCVPVSETRRAVAPLADWFPPAPSLYGRETSEPPSVIITGSRRPRPPAGAMVEKEVSSGAVDGDGDSSSSAGRYSEDGEEDDDDEEEEDGVGEFPLPDPAEEAAEPEEEDEDEDEEEEEDGEFVDEGGHTAYLTIRWAASLTDADRALLQDAFVRTTPDGPNLRWDQLVDHLERESAGRFVTRGLGAQPLSATLQLEPWDARPSRLFVCSS